MPPEEWYQRVDGGILEMYLPEVPASTEDTKNNMVKTSWSIRPNPEDQINRKPDDQKNDPKARKYKKLEIKCNFLYLILGPIYI